MIQKKCQAALEFTSMLSLTLIIVLFALGAMLVILNDQREKEFSTELKNLGFEIQEELVLAATVHNGYERYFELPEEVKRINYSVLNINNTLILSYEKGSFIFRIPKINGDLKIGTNRVRKMSGELYVD